EYAAVAIFAYSIKYIYCRRLVQYILLVILASAFHITAIVTIPLYFILYRKPTLRFYTVIALAFLISVINVALFVHVLGLSTLYLNPSAYGGIGVNLKSVVLVLFF